MGFGSGRTRSASRKSARRGGRIDLSHRGTCGRLSEATFRPQQEIAGRDRDERASLAVERFSPRERRARRVRGARREESGDPPKYARGVRTVLISSPRLEKPFLPSHDRVIFDRQNRCDDWREKRQMSSERKADPER